MLTEPRFSELLASNIFYAREFHGKEESDRWSQSLVLVELAKECFELAPNAVVNVRSRQDK